MRIVASAMYFYDFIVTVPRYDRCLCAFLSKAEDFPVNYVCTAGNEGASMLVMHVCFSSHRGTSIMLLNMHIMELTLLVGIGISVLRPLSPGWLCTLASSLRHSARECFRCKFLQTFQGCCV